MTRPEQRARFGYTPPEDDPANLGRCAEAFTAMNEDAERSLPPGCAIAACIVAVLAILIGAPIAWLVSGFAAAALILGAVMLGLVPVFAVAWCRL